MLLPVALFACDRGPSEVALAPVDGGAVAAQAFTCPTSIARLAPLLTPGAVRVFGEIHGTNQIPAFVGDAACQAAASGAVTVALEIPTEEQGRFEQYLASDGTPAARAALLAGPFWAPSNADGRSSEAMLNLLERVRVMRNAGANLEVLTFDQTLPGLTRDASMAAKLVDAAQSNPGRVLLVEVGNLHARMVVGTPFNPTIENMAYLMAARLPGAVQTFDAAYQKGTAWCCNSSTCGVDNVWGADSAPVNTMEVFATTSPDGYSGRFHVGALSAAFPAAQ